MHESKPYKTGVQAGGGPEPGYLWTVLIDEHCHEEAIAFLNDEQYQHVALQVKELAKELNPRISQTIDIDQVDDFYEIRDKGGSLGKNNVRVYFHVDDARKRIVLLSTWNKKKEGATPDHIKLRVQRRMRLYLEAASNL